jgi:Flp pilus assembly protein TadG
MSGGWKRSVIMITIFNSLLSKVPARASCFCRSWARDESGSIAIITAVSLAVLLAFGGLGVDAALWMRAKYDAQGAADAAANSVAAAAAIGNPASRLAAEANAAAAANGFQNGMNGVTITTNNPPASGAYAGNASAYEVIVSAPQKRYLASALAGTTAPIVKARAVALLTAGTPAPTFPTCVLGLSPQPSQIDVTFNGNTKVTATGCDVDADSPSSSSINTNGGGSVHADNVRTVGGVSGGNIFVTGKIYTQQTSIPDPYASRTMPSMPSFSSNNSWSGSIQNTGSGSPPVMAFNGDVRVSGNTTLSPGIYMINNGSLLMAGQNSLTGSGVTIILTSSTPASDNGVFSITGGGGINLTAPTTGPTAGIALWADSRLPNNQDKFAGGTTGNLVGAIYLPSHDVKYAGNSATASKCMQLVAYNVVFTGTSSFNHNCTGVGTSDPQGAPTPASWSLVE